MSPSRREFPPMGPGGEFPPATPTRSPLETAIASAVGDTNLAGSLYLVNFSVVQGTVTAKSILLLPQDTSTVPVTVRGAAGSTQNVMEVYKTLAAANPLFRVDSAGNILVGNSAATLSIGIYQSAADTRSQVSLQGGANSGIAMGAGGATDLDLWLLRTAASIVTLAADNGFVSGSALEFLNQTAPGSPAAGAERLYGNAGILKWKDSSGNIYNLDGSGTAFGPLTTKGDIFTRSTVNARLAVGADNEVLIADSTKTSGLKWFKPAGGLARRVNNVAIANTETVVLADPTVAGYMDDAGQTYRIRATGTLTTGVTPGSGTFNIRVGPTTLTGVIPATITLAQTASVTDAPFVIEADFAVRSAGATGTLLGNIWLAAQNGAAPIAFTAAQALVSATTATVTFDATAANLIELTYISGNAGSTATFRTVTIELVSVT